MGGFTHTILQNNCKKTERPVIFAVTHVGKFDIEVVSEAIRKHYYLLTGDYEYIQGTVDELFLNLNGVIYFNEKVKADRKGALQKMIKLLQKGGNLMYFPEGTWNLSPNLPLLPCFWGIVEVAQKGNAIIVPIAAEQYGKHFDITIGENFDMNRYGTGKEEKSLAITELRDVLATLKWEIWERHQTKRSMIASDEWTEYCNARFREWSYFNLDYIDKMIYKPKDVTAPEEAFAFIERLRPCKENAFLFRGNINSIKEKE